MRDSFLCILLVTVCLSVPGHAHGGVVVNEVLANEPGGYRSLEWFELFADTSDAVSLAGFEVAVGEDTIRFADTIVLPVGGYLVVCRKLVSSTGAASFEGHWGDSSGVWGDYASELEIRTPLEASFVLHNSSGAVRLLYHGAVVSELTWDESGDDGVSWERVAPDGSDCGQSEDPAGGTPGRTNSLTPVGQDLALLGVTPITLEGETEITIRIGNRGAAASPETSLELQDSTGAAIDMWAVPCLEPGECCVLVETYVFDGMYVSLAAQLPQDDRPDNNRREFLAGGREYPPFLLSEFLANPDGGGSEWVEIRNAGIGGHGLAGWQLGDERLLHVITDSDRLVLPGERVVLVQDEATFLSTYPDFAGLVLQPDSWATLNNDCDTVRLVDPHGLSADRCGYGDLPTQGCTWARSETGGSFGAWGRSQYPGGSPGEVNRVVLAQETATLSIEVVPRVFSPDGDGHEDEARVAVAAPRMDDFELAVYDRDGRRVRRLDEETFDGDGFVWDGRDGSGRRLPVGIYVIYVEVAEVGSAKATVVVAR